MKKGLVSLLLAGLIFNSCSINKETARAREATKRYLQLEVNKVQLEENEYIIPTDVFVTYAKIIDPLNRCEPLGHYINYNWLRKNKKIFYERITGLGYSKAEAEMFYNVLSKKGNIVFSTSALSSDFESLLLHERIHREFNNLSKKERELLCKAHGEIKDKKVEIAGILQYLVDDTGKGLGALARNDCSEFFSYLAEGVLKKEVEEELKKFPAYKVFNAMKERAK